MSAFLAWIDWRWVVTIWLLPTVIILGACFANEMSDREERE